MNETTVPANAGYSAFNALVDIVAAPAKALDEVKTRTRWLWWPLAISVISFIAVFAFYYSWVDFDWMIDEMARASVPPGQDAAAVAEQMRALMSPGMQTVWTAIGMVVMTFLIYAIQSAYLHIVNKVAGDAAIGYGQWFSFSAWTGFVGVFNAIAMLVVILMASSNQVSPNELSPLSINSLLVGAEPGDAWFTWANSLTLVHLWMLGLMTFGFSRWTGSSMGKAAAVVVTPWALIFGIWAAVIAF